MCLNQLTLTNFRCFERLEIDFHPRLTVLIAPNGSGKTTILDAARIALWPFVSGFDLGSQTGKGATIQPADVRLMRQASGNMEPQLPSALKAQGFWHLDGISRQWTQNRQQIKPRSQTLADAQTKEFSRYAEQLQQQVRAGIDPVTLPLVSYLGTSRLWFEGRFTSVAEDVTLNRNDYSRTSGYLNCLSYASSFKAFSAWYGWIYRSYREEQIAALEQERSLSEQGQRFASMVQVIKAAVNALISGPTGWRDLEYRASQNQQLVLSHEHLGSLPLDMLSDGLRNAISMVADLAFRACKLNPHLGERAALETPGVALIDEVDMFLHPAWQQTIIASLQSAFPRMQFIVTTHSPQVLTTVHRDSIRVLDGNGRATSPLGASYGQPSGTVLRSVMAVDPQPPVAERQDLQRLTEWVD